MLTPKLTLVESLSEVNDFMHWLSEDAGRTILGADVETTGLDWWKDEIRTIQFGDQTHGWCFPYPEWKGVVDEVIRQWEGDFVFHNAKFDLHFLEHNGHKLPRYRVHDTMLMTHLYNNELPIGLKPATSRYVDGRAHQLGRVLDQAKKTAKWDWDTVPRDFPAYWMYAAMDPVLTVALYDFLVPRITDYMDAYDIEISCMQVLIDMEQRGMQLDIQYCETRSVELAAQAQAHRVWALKSFGVENLTSGEQVAKALIAAGVELKQKTPTGKYKMSKQAVEKLDHPLAKAMLEVRHLDKIRATYLENFLDIHNEGFIHPNIRQLGARTSRMSIDRPSMQNLERSGDVRNAFIARPDHTMMLIDYDQIELRMLTHYCQDPGLMEIFQSGRDPHAEVARAVYQIPEDIELETSKRQTAKNSVFALVYGAGIPQFALTAGISVEDAQQFMGSYHAKFPHVQQFINGVIQQANQRHRNGDEPYVHLYDGRRIQIMDSNKLYKLVNYLIQGGSAVFLKEKIVQLDLAGLADYLLLPVHDELVFDAPTTEITDYEHEVVSVMEEQTEFRVPFTVGAQRVTRWGSKYDD